MSALSLGSTLRALAGLAGFAFLMLAGYCVRRGSSQEAIRDNDAPTFSARIPWKTLAALSAGAGTAVGALALTIHNSGTATIYGVGAAAGVLLTYGFDRWRSATDTGATESKATDLAALLERAEATIGALETAGDALPDAALRSRLRDLTHGARDVLAVIDDDPDDLGKARTFVEVHLQGALTVTAGYARNRQHHYDPQLEASYRKLLDSLERTIRSQKMRLLQGDAADLDAQIRLLKSQLWRERVSN